MDIESHAKNLPKEFNKESLLDLIKTSECDLENSSLLWKKKEVGLILLGSFSNDIIVYETKSESEFDIEEPLVSLVKDVEGESSNSIMKGRTLWCLSKYSEMIAV